MELDIELTRVLYIMRLLYIIGLVMDLPGPIRKIVRTESIEPLPPVVHIPNPLYERVKGYDERFLLQPTDESSEIPLWLYYLEQIRRLEKKPLVLEEIQQDLFLKEFFHTDITPGQAKAGGLMDDWLRNVGDD